MADYHYTFQNFMEQAIESDPRKTRGMAIHNLLMYTRRDLADQIINTNLDPFSDDKRIEACLNWLEQHWGTMKRRDARPVKGARNNETGRLGFTRFRRASRSACKHENGWRNVCDDGRHDVLVRECADNCGETKTIGQANQQRWHRAV